MSREYEFHKLIESQDEQHKKDLWQNIQHSLEEDNSEAEINGNAIILKSNKQKLKHKIAGLVLSFVVLTIAVIAILISPVRSGPVDNFRYCNKNEYYINDTDKSVKQYAAENNKDIKYFSWFDEVSYFADKQCKLNTTDEVICLYEEIIDLNDAYVQYYITDNKTEIDLIKPITDLCVQTVFLGGVKINCCSHSNEGSSSAWFEYSGYKYYLSVEDGPEQDYVLTLISELLDM